MGEEKYWGIYSPGSILGGPFSSIWPCYSEGNSWFSCPFPIARKRFQSVLPPLLVLLLEGWYCMVFC